MAKYSFWEYCFTSCNLLLCLFIIIIIIINFNDIERPKVAH